MSLNKVTLKFLRRGLEEVDHEHEHNEEHGDHDDHDEHEELDIDTFKILLLVLMILCVALGVIPKQWSRCRENEAALSFINSFAAGVFLAITIVHLMPKSVEIYETWAAEEKIERAFPLPFVMTFVGYMLILVIDRVAAKKIH